MKKLLSLLSIFTMVGATTSTIVSCSTPTFNIERTKAISNRAINSLFVKDLGELNDLKPLRNNNDANVLNTDNKGTLPHRVLGLQDYSTADDRIGTYEIANVLFKRNGIDPNLYNLYGFKFVLAKNPSVINGYKMIVIADNGKQISCYFTSNQNIQLSVNSVIDDSKEVHVKDGDVHTIEKAFTDLSTDKSVKLGIWNRENPDGVRTVNIDSQTGKGTIQLFDETHKYGGFVNAKVIIDNYKPLNFDWFGNPYNFYDNRTAEQIKAINSIDESYKTTEIKPDKHVILFGFDGIRFDKFLEYEKPYLEKDAFTVYSKDEKTPYYQQPSESVFGWKENLTGSIDGNSVNIFNMVNNAKNKEQTGAIGNFMWDAFETKVFAQHDRSGLENIKESFSKNDSTKGLYNNNGMPENNDVWIKKAKEIIENKQNKEEWKQFKDVTIPSYHGTIDNQAYKKGIWKPTENEKKFSLLKSYITCEMTNDMAKSYYKEHNNMPNLVFNYDTEEDDEGHAFDDYGMKSYEAFYNSQMAKDTFKEYAREMNDAYKKYGNDKNYLILQIVDHGRNSVDSGHSVWDPDARTGWMVSNKDNLEELISTNQRKDINQYSIKEIIWNWLTK